MHLRCRVRGIAHRFSGWARAPSGECINVRKGGDFRNRRSPSRTVDMDSGSMHENAAEVTSVTKFTMTAFERRISWS